jgi:hypothetical protein
MAAFRKCFSEAQNEAEMGKIVNPETQPNGIKEFACFDLGQVLSKQSGASRPKANICVASRKVVVSRR